jgi:hypothetical protein
MTTATKPMGKRRKERLLSEVNPVLTSLYNRMDGHIHRYVTDDDVIEKMVKPQDREMVYRSDELFGYVRSSYYGGATMRVHNFPGMEHPLLFGFSGSKFLVPHYLRGNVTAQSLGDDFIQLLKPYVEAAAPIRTMYLRSVKAWLELRKLCDDDLARIQFLWPSIDAIAQRVEIPITHLAKPRGVPSPDPALREALNEAATFINTALMMPPPPDNRRGITYSLEA